MDACLQKWSGGHEFGEKMPILRPLKTERIHANCEDYRAAATIDLVHDREDGEKLDIPLQVLWGEKGVVGRKFNR